MDAMEHDMYISMLELKFRLYNVNVSLAKKLIYYLKCAFNDILWIDYSRFEIT